MIVNHTLNSIETQNITSNEIKGSLTLKRVMKIKVKFIFYHDNMTSIDGIPKNSRKGL